MGGKRTRKENVKKADEEAQSSSIKLQPTLRGGKTVIPPFKEYIGSWERRSRRTRTILRHTIQGMYARCMKVGRWVALAEVNKWGSNFPDADATELRKGKGSPKPPEISEKITCFSGEIFLRIKDGGLKKRTRKKGRFRMVKNTKRIQKKVRRKIKEREN